jgi:hypothetical protein
MIPGAAAERPEKAIVPFGFETDDPRHGAFGDAFMNALTAEMTCTLRITSARVSRVCGMLMMSFRNRT